MVPRGYVAPSGMRLGQWVATQRLIWRRQEMGPAAVEALGALPGWVWSMPTGRAAWAIRRDLALPPARSPLAREGLSPALAPGEYGARDGHGRFGIVDRDDEGRVVCHECGRSWEHLAPHVWQAHGLRVEAYRERHGLSTGTRLVGEETRARMRAGWQRHEGQHLADLAAHRDPDAARAGNRPGSRWRPELVAGTPHRPDTEADRGAGRHHRHARVGRPGPCSDRPRWGVHARDRSRYGPVAGRRVAATPPVPCPALAQQKMPSPSTAKKRAALGRWAPGRPVIRSPSTCSCVRPRMCSRS